MGKEEIEIIIREAIPDDAEQLIQVFYKIGSETPYLVMDENGAGVDTEEMAHNLAELYESLNNVLMVAVADGQVIGTASVKASSKQRMEHIGEIGISILKEFWGLGLGGLMMEELIDWSKDSGIIRRLELTVQDRNQRAVHLYEKLGFKTEVVMERGAKTDEGEFLKVRLMSMLID
ncbi:N-acetyltransferase family protein [Enterococcus sp. LJL128]|uniref:GNAT family N-acetyltransferase n=1 Tax=Enterococcus sp. LJL51 TaxID=3416656 RepID=UPI003CEE6967